MKKILVIAPVLEQWSEVKYIKQSLSFLSLEYNLDFVDPIENLSLCESKNKFYFHWQQQLEQWLPQYQLCIGLSFGGVILQYHAQLLENAKMPCVLFSTPSFADQCLFQKLSAIIKLAQQDSIFAAIAKKNEWVFFPNQKPLNAKIENTEEVKQRMILGYQLVLDTNNYEKIKNTQMHYQHFIGAQSLLVNRQNVISSVHGQLIEVPHAGMRVLQDNAAFCKTMLLQYLEKNMTREERGASCEN